MIYLDFVTDCIVKKDLTIEIYALTAKIQFNRISFRRIVIIIIIKTRCVTISHDEVVIKNYSGR